ncbi:sucrase ferredoxin [Streptomyces sp. AJS327]|nr:sucrase ferredoxin [Streptomyces sp. AJS327]
MAEPLTATAATARTWLLVEQPGPWGGKALTRSHLDPELGARLEARAEPHGVRVALIRRPGPHADRHRAERRGAFLAHTLPGASWVRTTVLEPGTSAPSSGAETIQQALDALDFAALGAGDPGGLPPRWTPYRGDPLVLVCTNGKRDQCCALQGRPLAAELAASGAADVWEITHIGGHRFAPTLLVLPYGYAYGRADAPTVKSTVLAARDGRIALHGCRGRSAWDRPGQAADLAVRAACGEHAADALAVTEVQGAESHWTVTVAHRDGRGWRVRVHAEPGEPAPASCGAAPTASVRMRVAGIEPTGPSAPSEAAPLG